MSNINQSQDERLERFFKGQMSEEEKTALRADLAKDSELRSQAAAMAFLIKSMRKVGAKRDELLIEGIRQGKQKQQSWEIPLPAAGTDDTKGSAKIIHFTARIIAIAACCVLAFGFYDRYQVNTQFDELALASLSEYGLEIAEYDDVLGAYKGGEATQQQLQLQTIYQEIAQGQHLDKNIEALIPCFEQSLSDTYNEYTTEMESLGYYLALAYLQDHDRDAALTTLKKVQQLNPDVQRVNELLDKLEQVDYLW